MTEIKTGIYEHYSGKRYKVLGLGHHSESLEPLVFYQALYDSEDFGHNALWARPADMFQERIEKDGKLVPRFRYLGESA